MSAVPGRDQRMLHQPEHQRRERQDARRDDGGRGHVRRVAPAPAHPRTEKHDQRERASGKQPGQQQRQQCSGRCG